MEPGIAFYGGTFVLQVFWVVVYFLNTWALETVKWLAFPTGPR